MHMYGGGQRVDVTRDVSAIEIPSGRAFMIEAGSVVYITQILGGMFTVETEQGFLARIDGRDAEAIGQSVPSERAPVAPLEGQGLEDLIWQQLRTCYDPEIPVNIVELGLIYKLKVEHEDGAAVVTIVMTLTAPGCGMGEILKQDIETKVSEIEGVKRTQVELVFDPPWDREMMSEAARLQLGMF